MLQIFPVFFKYMMMTINKDVINQSYNSLKYIASNRSQREKAFAITDEFNEYLKNISGKCIDIGCGPGDVTKDIILPALDPNAIVIGKNNLYKIYSTTY